MLAAVFVQRHRGSGCRVVAVRQAVHGDFDNVVQQLQHVFGDAQALVTDDQHRARLEPEVVQALRAGCLFQTDKLVAIRFQFSEYGWQRAAEIDMNLIDGIARDFAVDFRFAADDHPTDPTTTGRTHNARQVHVASHRWAGQHQLGYARLIDRRFMALMLEFTHGTQRTRMTIVQIPMTDRERPFNPQLSILQPRQPEQHARGRATQHQPHGIDFPP